MTDFSQRVALITGAGSGIGRQLAHQLARQGAVIAAIDLATDSLSKLEAELPGTKLAWQVADVTDREALAAAVGKLEERLGPIDLLFASAGIACETNAVNYRAEDIEGIIRVNLIGVSNSIGAVLPGMIQRRRGHVVALSSLASFRGFPRMAGYCASKAGVNALMDSLRVELRDSGVQFTTICPGWIRTPMTDQVDAPMDELMEPEEAVRQMLEAVRRCKPFYAFPRRTARRVRIVGMLPAKWSDWLIYRMLRALKKK
jgi:NAD(P)-dependent dehydrogenase (short-subunit alcohol dehydrogenase family)